MDKMTRTRAEVWNWKSRIQSLKSTVVLAAWVGVGAGPVLAGAATTSTRPAAPVRVDDRLLGTTWYGVYLLGQKLGWMSTTLSATPDKQSYQVTQKIHFLMKIGSAPAQENEFQETRTYSGSEQRLTAVELVQTVGGGKSTMTGRAVEGAFEYTHHLGGAARTQRLPLPTESLADMLWAPRLALDHGAQPGARAAGRYFDASLGKEFATEGAFVRRENVPLDGVLTPLVVIESTIPDLGISSTTRFLPDGRSLDGTVAVLFRFRLENEQVARQIDIALDSLATCAIRLKGELPDPARMKELALVISGLDDPRFVLASERRTYEKTDTPGAYRLTLRRDRYGSDDLVRGPYDRAQFAQTLGATAFIQSDDPKIAALAKEVLGDEQDPAARVGKLVSWVHANVKTEYTSALSSALDVVQTRKGDCTEHTILFVALCRAAGIPAEEVAGVMYLPGAGGLFAYHAWARVWIGKWIEVDPTWNQTVADAAHIAFVIGPLEKQAALVGLIGRVKIDVLSYKVD
jgi:hypothetical protein